SIAMVVALSEILIVALGVWTYTGPRWMSLSLGHGTQWNVFVWLETGLFFGLVSAVYIFRDDKGQRLVERSLERHTPRVRKAVAMMALYACVQLVAWGPGEIPVMALSFFQAGWANLTAPLV